MGLFMVKSLAAVAKRAGYKLDLRVGIHTGRVIAGVIGIWKFKYGMFFYI
jgi:adenylate cyclase